MPYVLGIDEAGRGPLAGPVSVGVVRVQADFDRKFFKGIKDSKMLSSEERELWFSLAKEAHKTGELDYAVALISEKFIDKKGINAAISLGIKRCLARLGAGETECHIFLDGGLKAPQKFPHQTTVIKGDEKIPVISLASICAKVTRDRYMVRLSKKYPEYGFDEHKGYGTRKHKEALKKAGASIVHRQSFLRNLTKG